MKELDLHNNNIEHVQVIADFLISNVCHLNLLDLTENKKIIHNEWREFVKKIDDKEILGRNKNGVESDLELKLDYYNFDIRDFSDFLRKQRDYKYVPIEIHLEHMVKSIDTDKWNNNPQHEDERDLKDFINAINTNSIIDN